MTRRIQSFVAGQPLTGIRRQLNDLVRVANDDRTPGGSVGTLPGFLAHNLLVVQIRSFDGVAPNFLITCTLPGQELNPSAQEWAVAPPWTINEASRQGVNYTYTDINNRTADSPAETQVLTPVYLLNDFLVIAEIEQGRTWRDLNIDGRQWAQVPP